MEFIPLEINTQPKYFNQIMKLLYNEWSNEFKKSGYNTIKDVTDYYKTTKNIRFFFLLTKNKVIACYSFKKIDGNLFICDVVVEKSYREKGYSKRLMKDAFTRAINEGWSKMYLHASSNLVPFYQKFGFKVIKKTKKDRYCMMVILNEQKRTLTQYFILFVFACTVGVLTLFVVD